jgi:guanylate kinase
VAVYEHRGNVFVVSAPSGTGKSTLSHRLVQSLGGILFSISFTTRAPRAGEVDGKDYFFIDNDKFDQMVERGEFVEWVEVYGRKYGTGRTWLESVLSTGQDVLLDIETTGAQNVRKAIPDARMIFILPPSKEDLERRLRGRGKDSEEQIQMRLQHARHEMEQIPHYDYLVVNQSLEQAYRQFESIVLSARAQRERMNGLARRILDQF